MLLTAWTRASRMRAQTESNACVMLGGSLQQREWGMARGLDVYGTDEYTHAGRCSYGRTPSHASALRKCTLKTCACWPVAGSS